jgi:hypothetical protein
MSIVDPSSTGANIVARVKSILLQPKATWEVIDGEAATVSGLYRGYVIPLAAIPAVCGLIGGMMFSSMFGVVFKPNPVWVIVQHIIQYGLSLAMVYVMALIIDGLVSNFGGTRNQIQAFKVAVYASTASWIGGVFLLLPALAPLSILTGLYSLYLLYRGLPRLMKVEEDRAVAFTALVVVVAAVLSMVIWACVGAMGGMARMMSPMASSSGAVSGTINTPAGSIDLGKLEAASKQMEATQKAAANGQIKLTDPEVLKAYLPGAVSGYARTGVSAESSAAGGMGASTAKGAYQKGDASLNLSVVDMGAAGALAGMAGAFNVQSSHEENGRYEKVGKVGGRMTTETYDRNSKHGEYSVMVGDRFMVQAEGDNVSIDDLKAAVSSIDAGRLEGLAKS